MKKPKNAFTLIELLAVIVILAVIALIATPIILGIVEDAKKDAFLRSVELVISTTDIDIANKTFEENYTYEITDGNISNLEVSVKNTDGMNGSITYDVNGKEVYAIHNGVYCVTKTSDMSKAEISDYAEGKCKLISTFEDGQIVYFDVENGIGCTMEDYVLSYDTSDEKFQNSLIGYNGLNGTGNQNSCLLFYAFNDDGGENLYLLLDHNAERENSIYEGLEELKTFTSSWKGTIASEEGETVRYITAGEIAHITGMDLDEDIMFDEKTSDYNSSFSFDLQKYSWLATSGTSFSGGYWTSSPVGRDTNDWYWKVDLDYAPHRDSFSGYISAFGGACYDCAGTRPVITVSKSIISKGVAPVIPQQ